MILNFLSISTALIISNDPVLYTDSGDKLAIDNLSFSGSAMSISASCDEVPHEITLNMPMVRKLTTDQVIVKSVTGLESDVVFHEQDGVTTLELVYAPEDLPVLPRLASMIYTLPGVETPVTLNCVVSNQFYDTEGNVISGRLLFIVPDNFVCPDTYDLLLKGTVELVDTVSTDIQIKR